MSTTKELFRFIITEVTGPDPKFDNLEVEKDPNAEAELAANPDLVAAKIGVEATADGSGDLIHEALVRTFVQHEEMFDIFRRAVTAAMIRKIGAKNLAGLFSEPAGEKEAEG